MRHGLLLLGLSLHGCGDGGSERGHLADQAGDIGAEADEAAGEVEQTVIGMCVGSCASSEDCAVGYVCRDERVVTEGFACHPAGAVDDIDRFELGACATDLDCGARQRCSAGVPRLTCVPACQVAGCPAERPYCSATGECGTCDENLGCFPDTGEWCGLLPRSWGYCLPSCIDDEDCPGGFCGDR